MTVLVNLHEHTILNSIFNAVLDGFGHVEINGKEVEIRPTYNSIAVLTSVSKMRLPLFYSCSKETCLLYS